MWVGVRVVMGIGVGVVGLHWDAGHDDATGS